MSLHVPSTKYICINFPGIVNDHRKALETLGSESKLFEVFRDKRKRLELKFRRDEEFSRGCFGNHSICNSIVLHVKRRKNIVDGNYTLCVQILAYVDTLYSFNSLCDYQYQPIERIGSTSEFRSLQPYLTIDGFHSRSWLFEKVPIYLPAPQYSRYDKEFNLKQNLKGNCDSKSTSSNSKAKESLFWRGCKRNFSTPCPQITNETLNLIEDICQNPYTKTWYISVKECFEQKPIWLALEIASLLNIDVYTLKKKIISAIAYYFCDGPWSRTWVRFGYDPLVNSSSKIYQTVDCRLKKHARNARSFKNQSILQVNTTTLQEEMLEENFKFIPNVIPTNCHVMYMIGDISIEEIQNLLHSNDGKESICTDKDGWLPAGTIDNCRVIMKEYYRRLIESKQNEESSKIDDQNDCVDDDDNENDDRGSSSSDDSKNNDDRIAD